MRTFAICAMVLISATAAHAAFSTADGYMSRKLYDSAGTYTLLGGLALDDGALYFGQGTDILTLDLDSASVATVGTVASNVGNALVERHDGVTYTAFGTSLNSPYPHEMGYLDTGGAFVGQSMIDSLFDAAVSPSGECYIVAAPGGGGSQVLRYDWATGGMTLVADVGGSSGGVTFDEDGNLYYADQGIFEVRDAAVLKYTPQQLTAGNLTAADGEAVLDIAAGYMGFDEQGGFYATTGWGAALSCYDLAVGEKVCDVAFGGVGQFVWDGDVLYALSSDYGTWSTSVQAITVPEPTSVALLVGAGLLACRNRK